MNKIADTTIEEQQQHPPQRLPRNFMSYFGLALRGFAMGASDVVPGVSGGTMAFILGIYEELIDSIRALVNPGALKLLLRFKIKEALAVLPWKFLSAVGIGILAAIFSLAQFLEWMLKTHPALLWSFFFGLVLASIFTVSKRVNPWGIVTVASAGVGAVAAWFIVGLVPVETPNAPWFLFLSGALAICAMILPGVSGAFILVLLGKYEYVLSAVNNRDILTLFLVAAGAAVGIITFAQILGWLFKRFHNVTVAILIGLMLGSLRKIWPWKETVAFILDRHGVQIPTAQINVLPPAWTAEVTLALVFAICGFAIVFALDYLAASYQKSGVTVKAKLR